MAEIPDNLGRVGRFDNADLDSIASALKSAVGKAVEYAAGKAKTAPDDKGKRFDELVDAMEELGDDIKESLESTRKFVDEVKRAAEAIEKQRSSGGAGKDSLADAQREQTRVLQEILRSQQKAMADKAAKFTSGGTALAAPPAKRPALKEMGFRPRGTDRIPAMLSPGEFVVNRRGARGNEPLLNRINRGYMSGGKVKPAYLAGGTPSPDKALELAREMGVKVKNLGRFTVDLEIDPDIPRDKIEELIAEFGKAGLKAEHEFAEEFDKNLRRTLSSWVTGITQAFVGHDPWQTLFEGSVKDITEFRREMRSLAFQTEGITGQFREAQAEFAKIGDDIVARTGKSVTAFQKAYMANARKGYKDQKVAMKTMESGLKLSTLIGSETQATATLFADWHRDLNLGAVQMERMADNMQTVARNTGVTGDELLSVMKSSEGILKNLRNQGTLTTNAARNVTQAMAEFKKMGFEEEGQRIMSAMSSYQGFQAADAGTKAILQISAGRAGMDVYDVMHGGAIQDPEKMGQMAGGLKDYMAGLVGIDPGKFDMDELTEAQRKQISLVLESQGTSLAAAEAQIKVLTKGAAGLTGTLSEFDKASKDVTATQEQRKLAEKKMNDALLSGSMDVMGSVAQAAEKYKDMSLAQMSEQLGKDNKFGRDFRSSSKDMEAIAPYLSDALKSQFGLKGDQAQMAAQISAMDMQKQVSLRFMAGAEQLDKAMKAGGKSPKDFTKQMNEALAKGDMKRVKAIEEQMKAAKSELQTEAAQKVDPMTELERSITKLNETIRDTLSPFLGGFIDAVGGFGLFLGQSGAMLTGAYNMFGKDFIGTIAQGGLGTFLENFKMARTIGGADLTGLGIIDSMKFALSESGLSGFANVFTKALGPAMLLLGGIKGVMESSEANRTKVEGGILGALTGGAKTGSFITGRYGDEAGAVDKALGVAGAAAWGAAIGTAFAPGIGTLIGALVGGGAEIVKIITEGTDILQDILSPIQAVVDYISGALGDIWKILKSIFTLDFGGLISGVVSLVGRTVYAIFDVIFSTIRAVVIGLPKLILKALMMIWDIPKAIMDSIKNALAGLVDNPWVGPIFKVFSDAFNMIYDGFMAIWTPIAQIFSGLYTVFNDLGKALFGAGEGGGILSGVVWVLQKAVYALAYVISWLLYPVKALAWALGFVLKIVGGLISALIAPFQYLYDVLVGHSIVPDLVTGIISWFARLPGRIFGFLVQIPVMLGRALLRIPAMIGDMFSSAGSYFQSFGSDSAFGYILGQIGVLYSFIGGTIKNLVGMASGVLDIIQGIFTLDFGAVWEGVTKIGSSIVNQLSNVGNFFYKALKNTGAFLFKTLKRIPVMLVGAMKAVFFDFPSWLIGKLMDGVWSIGNFLFITLPKMMWDGFKKALNNMGKWLWDTLTWPFRKVGEYLNAAFVDFPKWLYDKLVGIFTNSGTYIGLALAGIAAWFGDSLLGGLGGLISGVGGFFSGLPGMISKGFASGLGGVWKWITGWVPSLKSAAGGVVGGLKSAAGGVVGGVSKVGSKALDFGKSLVPTIKDKAVKAFERLGGVSENIKKYASGFFEKGKGLFSGMLNKGFGVFGKVGGGNAKGFFSKAIGAGAGLFGRAGGATKGFFSKAMNMGTGLLGRTGGATKGFFSKAMNMGTGLLGRTGGATKGFFSKAMNMGTGLLGRLGGAKSVLNSVVGGDEGEDCSCALAGSSAEQTSLLSDVAGSLSPEVLQKGLGGGKGLLSKGKDALGGVLSKGKDALGGGKGLLSKGKDALGGVVGGGKGLLSKGKDALGGVFSKGKDALGGVVGGGKGLLGGMAGKVGGMFSKGGGLISGLFGTSGVGKAAGGLMSKGAGLMGSMFGNAGGFIAKMGLGGMGKGLLKKLPGVGAIAGAGFAIADLLQGNVGGAIQNLASGLAGAIPVIGPVLSTGIDLFGGTIAKGAGWLASKAWKGAKSLGSAVGGLASKAWEGAKGLGASISGFTGKLAKGAKGLGGMAWRGAKTAFSYTPTGMAMKAFASGKGIIGGLFGKGANIGTKVMSTLKSGSGLMGNLFGRAGNFIAKAGLSGVGKSLLKKLPGIGAIAGAGFALSSLIKGDIGGSLTHLASGLAGSIPLIGPVLSLGIDTFGKKLFKGAGFLWKGVESVGDKLKEGSTWLYDGIKGWFGDTWKGVKDWWSSLWGGGKGQQAAEASSGRIERAAATAATPVGQQAVPAVKADGGAVKDVEPVHLRDITGTILRDKAGSGGNKLHSDELSRMEEASNKQVTELEQIRQGIQELVSLMKPRGAGVAGDAGAMEAAKTKDPRRPVHAARFGKMKYGKVGGLANRSYVNNGEV